LFCPIQTQQREPYKSIWTKSHERSAARKYLTRNFKAGHITPNEHYLSRAGLRGRKRYIFLTIFVLVYIITIANLLVSAIILLIYNISATHSVSGIVSIMPIYSALLIKSLLPKLRWSAIQTAW